MARTIRLFLLLEAASFAVAASIHFGALFVGYEHWKAGVAEMVIAAVLAAGLALTWIAPAWTRRIGLAVQSFALIGTMVGIFTVVIGIGPRTIPDVAYHIAILAVLAWGLIVFRREGRTRTV